PAGGHGCTMSTVRCIGVPMYWMSLTVQSNTVGSTTKPGGGVTIGVVKPVLALAMTPSTQRSSRARPIRVPMMLSVSEYESWQTEVNVPLAPSESMSCFKRTAGAPRVPLLELQLACNEGNPVCGLTTIANGSVGAAIAAATTRFGTGFTRRK